MAQSFDELRIRFDAYQGSLDEQSLPFSMLSNEDRAVLGASARTHFPEFPFQQFADQLSQPAGWCEFVPLHLNVKACMYDAINGVDRLGFYIGTKGYMTPDKAELLLLDFNADVSNNILLVNLTAKRGPFGSSNYDFQIRAISADGGVYLEFDLYSEPGLVANLAKLYLATVGRNKIGFSKDGKNWKGEDKFVRGQRGGAERNIVRYLLSIQAYFETFETGPDDQHYDRSLERWFDLTTIHSKQLYEMSKSDYLSIKKRERKNQFILLESIESNVTPFYEIEKQNP